MSQFDLNLRACERDCHLAASWVGGVVADSAAAMNTAFPPDTGTRCSGTSQSASWWPSAPTVGVSSLGIVVVHNPHAIVKCPQDTNPFRVPPIGRVISTF